MRECLKNFFIKYKLQFIFIIIGTTLCNILSLSYLYIYKHIINGLVDNLNISAILKWILILFFILVINTLLSFYVYSFYFKVFKVKIANDLRLTMFKNMIFSPLKFFRENTTGSLMIKILEDTKNMSEYISLYYFIYFSNTLRFIITFAFLFNLNTHLALLILLSTPIYYLSAKTSFKKLEFYNKEERKSFDNINQNLNEKIENIKPITIFSFQNYFIKMFNKDLNSWFSKEKKIILWNGLNDIFKNFIFSFMPILIFLIGLYEIKYFGMSIGALVSFLGMIDAAYIPVSEIIYYITSKHSIKPYFDRNSYLVKQIPDFITSNINLSKNSIATLKASNLFFSYEGDKNTLVNVNLEIDKPGLYKIEGSNGHGKSTLFNVLFNLDKVQSGNLYINGDIGFLPQENYIFNGSFKENLFINDSTNKKSLSKLIDLFNLSKFKEENFIDKNSISGGESKKICLTRTLKDNKDIFFLDEPTEYLDIESKNTLINYLNNLKMNKIILIISHDADIEKIADKKLTF